MGRGFQVLNFASFFFLCFFCLVGWEFQLFGLFWVEICESVFSEFCVSDSRGSVLLFISREFSFK